MYSQGIHARSGVACADCHMPYHREGALKVSDHQVRSPVLNLSAACQTCHHFPEAELKARVEIIQDRTHELRDRAMTALVALIGDLRLRREAGAPDRELVAARYLQRRAQFYLDFVEAENSTGFHAPAGGRADPGPGDRLRAAGTAHAAGPDVRVDRADRGHPDQSQVAA